MRLLKTILLWLLVAYAVLAGALFMVMRQPPERFAKVMAQMPRFLFPVLPFKSLWLVARDGGLKVGDPAPDFNLQTLDRKSVVRLSSLRGRPVILVFGSYT